MSKVVIMREIRKTRYTKKDVKHYQIYGALITLTALLVTVKTVPYF